MEKERKITGDKTNAPPCKSVKRHKKTLRGRYMPNKQFWEPARQGGACNSSDVIAEHRGVIDAIQYYADRPSTHRAHVTTPPDVIRGHALLSR